MKIRQLCITLLSTASLVFTAQASLALSFPLTIQNNTSFILTNGASGTTPNTNQNQLWIESFLKDVLSANATFMNVYVKSGIGPIHGCIYFSYQVTNKDDKSNHGSVGGSYCPTGSSALRAWSSSTEVNMTYGTQSGDNSFTINPR
jgi:hypothetical protein